MIMLQTGLSPLLQKVNLKRKHDEDSESEKDEMERTRSKRQKHGEEEGKQTEKGKERRIGKRKLGVKRTIEQRLNQAEQTGLGGCPKTAPPSQ